MVYIYAFSEEKLEKYISQDVFRGVNISISLGVSLCEICWLSDGLWDKQIGKAIYKADLHTVYTHNNTNIDKCIQYYAFRYTLQIHCNLQVLNIEEQKQATKYKYVYFTGYNRIIVRQQACFGILFFPSCKHVTLKFDYLGGQMINTQTSKIAQKIHTFSMYMWTQSIHCEPNAPYTSFANI